MTKSTHLAEDSGTYAGDQRAGRVVAIILNWNGADDTIQCVRSVQARSDASCTCLVVDNGSTDGSAATIRAACPEVRVHETGANLGFAGGCNAGIRIAIRDGAEYVWLINNDAIPADGAYRALRDVADAHPAVGGVGAVLRYMADPNHVQTWGGGWHAPWLGAAVNWTRPVPDSLITYLVGACLLLRIDALSEIGLLDEAYFMYREDVDLCVRMQRAGWQVAVAKDATVYHAVGGSSTSAEQRDRWIASSAVRYYRKHAPWPEFALAVETAGKIGARLMRSEWSRARTVWTATRRAWRSQSGN
ncbi:glycosyl transferase family 2 [Longibacter salinarum]|uniref:Glycosyl transferase family 2 n=1 Tax=Longibacter salinarum TaxID=1850348 RepID=A0A2A8D0U2_9BACT|nr:glycosyltransferase family 2 protein [Longibacter salinarum]PEN14500.1 glycosyl transferase family 2 [Longibacter salinarum]